MALPIRSDAPWQRLPWLVPPAMVLSLAALFVFERVMGGGLLPRAPAPIEMRVMELPPPPATPPPPAAPAPPSVAAPASIAPPPPVAAPTPQRPPPPVRAAQTPPPPAQPATPRAKPPAQNETRITAQRLREVTRQIPGLTTEPLMRSAPLRAEERQRLDKAYHVGHDEAGNPTEPMEGPRRAAGSVRLPPLTKAQWTELDRIYHVGAGIGTNNEAVMTGPLRAARSVPLPPLTKEQWAYLDSIYHVGHDPTDAVIYETGVRGALSEVLSSTPSIHAVVMTPMAAVNYSRTPTFVSHNDMAARAIQQPLPRLPAGMALSDGVLTAAARFRIAADGSSTVELTQATSDPSLDQLLLAALQKWRFTPAFQNGQAIVSTVEVRLTISH